MHRFSTIYALILLLILSGCSQLNKASDVLTNRTAREKYQRDFKISDELLGIWENQINIALNDSIQIDLPYLQAGHFRPKSFPIYSYDIALNAGERFDVIVESDSLSQLVFIDLYVRQNDSLRTFKKIESANYEDRVITREIEQPGIFKVVIQPEIDANSPFRIKMKKSSVYDFPVAGGSNKSVQSFWGAARDGGRRSHEGIDIFAARGTPVIAVTDGRITSSGERGLGGKQVWVRDPKRGQSLYYAHLDSIAPLGNSRVKAGDTLGFVGNTGNARTTPPHLHFGIYKGYRGAIDPLPYVYQHEEPDFTSPPEAPEVANIITRSNGNLRDQPTTRQSRIIANVKAQDTLSVLGKANDWYHVRTATEQAAFIHESLIAPN